MKHFVTPKKSHVSLDKGYDVKFNIGSQFRWCFQAHSARQTGSLPSGFGENNKTAQYSLDLLEMLGKSTQKLA